jgi:AcrR family transcriptional regulator
MRTARTEVQRGPSHAPVDSGAVTAAALQLFAERGYRSTTMADIGKALGVRGPSLYKHVRAKQDLLSEIMLGTMNTLLNQQRFAFNSAGDHQVRLHRIVEAHVRYHATHRDQAFVGNREIDCLENPSHDEVVRLRATYERGFRDVIVAGSKAGVFTVRSSQLASYAILDMGMGVAAWFSPNGDHTAEQIAYIYADYALQMLNVSRSSLV